MAILYDTVDFKYSCRNIRHTEALRTQMEVRRRLNEQLEVIQTKSKYLKPTRFIAQFPLALKIKENYFIF